MQTFLSSTHLAKTVSTALAVVALASVISVIFATPTAHAQSLSVVSASAFTGSTQRKPGFDSTQGEYRAFDTSTDLSFVGNGFAQAAVAKDTIAGLSAIHQAAYANDGYYGNGASWIGTSANSWLKIDLGRVASVESLLFGRDRLGSFNDRDPGQFFIDVALTDAVYANGDATSDALEYTRVFDSSSLGYNGQVNGAETLQATLAAPVQARFIKVTFTSSGAAIDELQVRGTVNAAAAPEPGSIALLVTVGIPVVGSIRRRKHSK